MKIFKKILKIILVLSLVGIAVTFFYKDDLPPVAKIDSQLYIEPLQTPVEVPAVTIEKNGFKAEIQPIFDYEIVGLVVEDYDSDVWHDIMHKKFDPFNTKDLCLVWGENLKSGLYNNLEYKHGEFTCFYHANDRETYKSFNPDELSNNHLIPSSDELYKTIKKSSPGDQVYIKGYLVNNIITTPEGHSGSRNSSTVRTDTGNGACESILVSEFRTIKKGNAFASNLYITSWYTLIISLVILILIFLVEVQISWRKARWTRTE